MKMICRLCLEEVEDYLAIFNKICAASESEIAKIVSKYFSIQLHNDDEISNVICRSCWQQLRNFHQFWLLIVQKQETLCQELFLIEKRKSKTAEVVTDEQNVPETKTLVVVETVDGINEACGSLCEPQIEGLMEESCSEEVVTEFGSDVLEIANDDQLGKAAKAVTSNKKKSKTQLNLTKRRVLSRKAKEHTTALSDIVASKRKVPDKAQRQTEGNARGATIRELDAYIAAHVPIVCCLCSHPLQDFSVLKKHFRKEHKCVGYVVCCNSRFRKRTLYVDHLKQHEDPNLFKCLKCSKVLASRGCYYNHMSTVHPPEEQLKFECKVCMRKFAKQYILDYHMKKHRGADHADHLCVECNKGYRTLYELKTHKKRVHIQGTVIICDTCGKHFKSKQSFVLHNSSVHQQVQLPEAQCQICQKWLKDERSLYKHMYKHRDEESGKQFICKICGTSKPTRQSLTGHIRYHHSGKAYKCTLCEKVFKRPRCLEEHMATHTGQDLYTCTFCAQTFKSHANMHSHKRKVHPNEWVRKYSQPTRQTLNNDDNN